MAALLSMTCRLKPAQMTTSMPSSVGFPVAKAPEPVKTSSVVGLLT